MKTKKLLNNREIASFCSELALIYSAGITPSEGISIMLSDSSDSHGKEILNEILEHCNAGNSFHSAIQACGVFPGYVVHMMTLGEESGNLDEVLKSLAEYYEREQAVSDSIRSAVTYPLVMIGMMLLVVGLLITKVLPIFNQVYVQLGSEMTGISRTLMNLGSGIQKYAIVLIILLCLLIGSFLFFTKTSAGRQSARRIFGRLPFVRGFYEQIAAGRFAGGMALTLASGMDTYNSLDMVADLVENRNMQTKIATCKSLIENGKDFSEAITEAGILSNLYGKMIAIAFRSGSVDTVMNKIAKDYEKETDNRIHSIISILEPTLVIILSVIVGFILLSVILPLMGIMSSIG